MNQRRLFRGLLLAALVLGVVLAQFVVGRTFLTAEERGDLQRLKIFSEAVHYVEQNYVESVSLDQLISGAIDGMLRSLDAHSSYMTRDLYKEVQIETSGQFGGLGMEITVRDGVLTVVAPIEDTPAWRAGIHAGDRIILIEEESTAQMNLTDALKRLRGAKGSKVALSIVREGEDEPLKFTITRDIIKIQSVRSADLGQGYAYMRIRSFQESTSRDLDEHLKKFEKKYDPLKGVVLDLRNNPGGLLEEAVSVSDLFLETGEIVSVKGRRVAMKPYLADKEGTHPPFLMVILVNKGSASASEIVAAALHDNDRAILVGSQTFGKGSVQTIVPLEDGSAVRVTTAYYYTPGGVSIHHTGVTPDILIDEREIYARAAEERKGEEGEERMPGFDPAKDPVVQRGLDLIKSWDVFSKTVKKPG